MYQAFGELGNHIVIKNGDVETVYAHCRTIYVSKEDMITKGQSLGEVGMTRKCYRSTLAF